MSVVKLHSVTLGSKELLPVLVLHGWRQSLESMTPLGELLSDIRHVHLVDLPGFGQSDAPLPDWGTGEYAKRISEYLDDSGISRADFIGHSFGGKVAMKLAATQPDRVSQLVLINSSGVRPRPPFKRHLKIIFVRSLRSVLRFLQRTAGIKLYETWFIPRFASADYKNAGPLRNTFVKIVNEDLDAEAKTIRAPALLLWGENDTETPVAAGEMLSKLIPNSELIVLPGKDHFAFAGSGAAVCAYHIKNFFKKHDGVLS